MRAGSASPQRLLAAVAAAVVLLLAAPSSAAATALNDGSTYFVRDSESGDVSYRQTFTFDPAPCRLYGCSIYLYAYDSSSGTQIRSGYLPNDGRNYGNLIQDLRVTFEATGVGLARTTELVAKLDGYDAQGNTKRVTALATVNDMLPASDFSLAVQKFTRDPATNAVAWKASASTYALRGDTTRVCNELYSNCTITLTAMNGDRRLVDLVYSQPVGERWRRTTTALNSGEPRYDLGRVTHLQATLTGVPVYGGPATTLTSNKIPIIDSIPGSQFSMGVTEFTRDPATNAVTWKASASTYALRGDTTRVCNELYSNCTITLTAMNGDRRLVDLVYSQPVGERWRRTTTALNSGEPRYDLGRVTHLQATLTGVPVYGGPATTLTSSKIPVSDDVRGGHDIIDAAALFAISAVRLQDPCIQAFPVGPHTNPSSLNDYQVFCEEQRAAGLSFTEIFTRMTRTFGAQQVLQWLVQSHDAAEPKEPTDPATPTHSAPSLDETYEQVAIGRLGQRLSVTSGNFTADAYSERSRQQVVRECAAMIVRSALDPQNCESMPIYSPGSDVLAAAMHDADALRTNPQWSVLTFVSEGSPDNRGSELRRGWYENSPYSAFCQEAVTAPSQCDEFPFYSTEEGGPESAGHPLASLRRIDTDANGRQGRQLANFYTTCSLNSGSTARLSPARKFLVIPVPVSDGPSSTAWCGS